MKKSGLFYFQFIALIGLIIFPFYANWYDYIFWAVMYLFMNSFGQGMVYHRSVAHKSWVAPRWYFIFANTVTTLAGVGSAIAWSANHLQHHRFSDTEKDPHSPHHDSKWKIYSQSMATDVNIRYAAPFLRDKTLVWFHMHYWHIHLCYILFLAVVYPFGIISLYLAPAHFTWIASCIFNTYCHLSGYRNFDTKDHSTNNKLIGWFSLGEGWHNNHHNKASSYTTKVNPNEYDLLGWVINKIRIDKEL